MGRVSKRENKNMYQLIREGLELSREEAEELLDGITADTIERIESEKRAPRPDEVLEMSRKYKEPAICNYFCSHDCEIGRVYVPEIKTNELSEIVLKMLASLNSTQDMQKRLIEITSDGKISNDELVDFVAIQKNLEQISQTVEALQFWVEKKLSDGTINIHEYNKILQKKESDK